MKQQFCDKIETNGRIRYIEMVRGQVKNTAPLL
jgi:hypothetical protein